MVASLNVRDRTIDTGQVTHKFSISGHVTVEMKAKDVWDVNMAEVSTSAFAGGKQTHSYDHLQILVFYTL